MWPRCSPAEDRGCPGGETSAQTMAGSQPAAIPFLQMALALGKASSSPVVGLPPHLLPSCWQHGAARTVYQLLTHTIFVSQRLHGCVWLISSGPSQKNTEKPKAFWGFSNQHEHGHHCSPSHYDPKVGLQVAQALISRQSPLREGLALRTPPDGSSFLLRWVPLWSHPPRPQAGLCVHHIWPLFKTPPPSIS